MEQRTINRVGSALNVKRFECDRVSGGLSIGQIMQVTGLDFHNVKNTLDWMCNRHMVMRFHVDGALKWLYYIRPGNWKD